jgi:thiol-disulfide isomerase/thioredoxin
MDEITNQPRKKGNRIGQFIALVIIGAGLVVLGIVIAKVISIGTVSNDISVVPSAVSFPAPDLTLDDLQGEKVTISDYNENIVMINNWATWCPPCKAEMPTLSRYYKEHRDQGFILVGIEAGDSLKEVQKFVKDNGISFPILLDPNNKSLIAFHNDNLPSSYVIDKNGNVILAWTGPISKAMLEKYITPLLEQ